jgi:hypothetical protein
MPIAEAVVGMDGPVLLLLTILKESCWSQAPVHIYKVFGRITKKGGRGKDAYSELKGRLVR